MAIGTILFIALIVLIICGIASQVQESAESIEGYKRNAEDIDRRVKVAKEVWPELADFPSTEEEQLKLVVADQGRFMELKRKQLHREHYLLIGRAPDEFDAPRLKQKARDETVRLTAKSMGLTTEEFDRRLKESYEIWPDDDRDKTDEQKLFVGLFFAACRFIDTLASVALGQDY